MVMKLLSAIAQIPEQHATQVLNVAPFTLKLRAFRSKICETLTSALTIVNCAYILKKAFNSDLMLEKVDALCQMLNVTTPYPIL